MRMFLRALVCLLLASTVAGCGLIYKPDIQQGNLLVKKDVDQLKPGMTKRQVLALLGSPSVTSPFDHERWDYLSTFSHRGEKRKERALSLYFNNDVLVSTEGNYFPQDASQLLKQTKKYGTDYSKKPIEDDSKDAAPKPGDEPGSVPEGTH